MFGGHTKRTYLDIKDFILFIYKIIGINLQLLTYLTFSNKGLTVHRK